MTEDCVFCKIIKGDIKADKILEGNNFIAFKDGNPRAEGHTLIVPKKHLVTLLDIPNHLGSELLEMLKKVAGELMDKKKGDGFNLIMNNLEVAGQVVMHAHLHVIPRNEGDGLDVLPRISDSPSLSDS